MKKIFNISIVVIGFGVGYYQYLKLYQQSENKEADIFYEACLELNQEVLDSTDDAVPYCNCILNIIQNDDTLNNALKHIGKSAGVKHIFQMLKTKTSESYYACAEKYISEDNKIVLNPKLRTQYLNQLKSLIQFDYPLSSDINEDSLYTCILETTLKETSAKAIFKGALRDKKLIQQSYNNCYQYFIK